MPGPGLGRGSGRRAFSLPWMPSQAWTGDVLHSVATQPNEMILNSQIERGEKKLSVCYFAYPSVFV